MNHAETNKTKPTWMYTHLYFICITGEHIHIEMMIYILADQPIFFYISINFKICVIMLIYFTAFEESN